MPAKYQKILCLAVIAGLFYLMRHLFFIIFLTFVLTYGLHSALVRLTNRFPYRRFNIVLLYSLAISLGLLGASLIAPQVASETRGLVKHYLDRDLADRREVLVAFDSSVREARRARAPKKPRQAAPFAYHPVEKGGEVSAEPEPPRRTSRVIVRVVEETDTEPILDREIRGYLDSGADVLLGRAYSEKFRGTEIYVRLFTSTRGMIADLIPHIIGPFAALINVLPILVLQTLLAIILSFLILWDLPGIGFRIAAALKRTEIVAIRETADMLKQLGSTIGRAFEAQTCIAVINTVVTAAGFWLIGLPAILFLSSVVFFCSFIPIFGVILSTLPAALLAFKVGGLSKVFLLVAIILIVHAVEAYVLDPLIYGYHLNIHPVLALVVLVFAEHFFGIWGLLLGIPVTTFLLGSVFPERIVAE